MKFKEEECEVLHWDDKNKECDMSYNVCLRSIPAETALMDGSEYHCSNEGKHICRVINSTERSDNPKILCACHAVSGIVSSSGP